MNVDELLAPMPFARFVGEFWDSKPLHIRGRQANYYDELAARGDIEDRLFGNGNLSPAYFKVYKGREELSPLHWSERALSGDSASSVVSPQKLLSAIRQGYSAYLNFPERMFPKIGDFLSALEESLKVKARSHLIISPPRSQGFLPHTDAHGVWALQLSGAKIWHSYAIREPSSSQGVDKHHLVAESPAHTFEVRAGDLLYLPRGTVHAAATTEVHSIHLSLGLLPPRGLDLIRLMDGIAEGQAFFQEYVPYSFGADDEARQRYARRFKDQLMQLIEASEPFELLERHHEATKAARQLVAPLTELLDVEEVTAATKVRVRSGIRFRLSVDASTSICRLAFEDVSLDFPVGWHAALEAVLGVSEFAVRALGESLPITDLERVRAARNLLHSRFLERVV